MKIQLAMSIYIILSYELFICFSENKGTDIEKKNSERQKRKIKD